MKKTAVANHIYMIRPVFIAVILFVFAGCGSFYRLSRLQIEKAGITNREEKQLARLEQKNKIILNNLKKLLNQNNFKKFNIQLDKAFYWFDKIVFIPETFRKQKLLDQLKAHFSAKIDELIIKRDKLIAEQEEKEVVSIEKTITNSDVKKYKPLIESGDYSFHVVLNVKVAANIKLFEKHKKQLLIFYKRYFLYRNIIWKILDKYNLPHDLIFLAMIESALRYNAYSYRHAGGFWQFMPSTFKLWSLKQNSSFVDFRYDLKESTKAAARYLQFLFNFWKQEFATYDSEKLSKFDKKDIDSLIEVLALASFNRGHIGIKNDAEHFCKNQIPDYWKFFVDPNYSLKQRYQKESQNYVPKIYAITIIMHNIENFLSLKKLKQIKKQLSLKKERVYKQKVSACFTFYHISKLTGLKIKTIKRLNPTYVKNQVPCYGVGKGEVVLPIKIKKRFRWGYKKKLRKYRYRVIKTTSRHELRRIIKQFSLSKSLINSLIHGKSRNSSIVYVGFFEKKDPCLRRYKIRKGDTLGRLSHRFKTKVFTLVAINKAISDPKKLQIGTKICVVWKGALPKSKQFAKATEAKFKNLGKHNKNKKKNKKSSKTVVCAHAVKIKKGDTLGALSKKYHVSISKLLKINKTNKKGMIYQGQKVCVKTKVKTKITLLAKQKKSQPDQLTMILDAPTHIRHTKKIKTKHTYKHKFHFKTKKHHKIKNKCRKYHKMKKGETVWSLSKKYKISQKKLLQANNFTKTKARKIKQGIVICIPN